MCWVRLCVHLQPFLACSVTSVHLIASLLLVCVSKRGWPLTMISLQPRWIALHLPQSKKWWEQGEENKSIGNEREVCLCLLGDEHVSREDKKRTRKKSCCRCWWWAYGKTKLERMERKTLSKDGDQRRLPVICVPLWGFLCFPLFVTVFFFICFFETVFMREKLQIQFEFTQDEPLVDVWYSNYA